VNPYLTYRMTIARIEELHRRAASQRLTQPVQRSRRQSWLHRLRLPSLGVSASSNRPPVAL
jgi:hypothetical protein